MSNQMSVIENNVFCVTDRAISLCENHKAVSIPAEQNYAVQQLYKNDLATKTAHANPVSVQNAILNLSSIGISLNPALKHAYLVPRDGGICLDISYMGLMHLAQEIGSIEWGQAKIVYANDTYENQGLNKEPLHKYNSFSKDRGEKVGVYCTVKLPTGDFLTEEMSAEEIAVVRNTSKSKNSSYSPWNTFETEMWRKSVVKRASKYWPKSSSSKENGNRFDSAVQVINEHEGLSTKKEDALKEIVTMYEGLESPLVMFDFANSMDLDDQEKQWVYANFPKGHKTKIAAMLKDGRDSYFEYKRIVENESQEYINECLAELSKKELNVVDNLTKIGNI
jgi:phage RecT family recombinase